MQLAREGALELKNGYQPRVPVLSDDIYIEIREVRSALERLATEMSVPHVTEHLLTQPTTLDRRFVAAEQRQDWSGAMEANRAFHFMIYDASRNRVLVRTIENLWLLTGPLVHMQYLTAGYISSGNGLHGRIIEALRRRAHSEAGDLVVQDLREGAAVILHHLRNPEVRRRGRRATRAAT